MPRWQIGNLREDVMMQQQIYEWIKHPEQLNRESLYELRTLLARYPYFQTARLLYLKNLFLLHDIAFGDELRRASLYIADRRMLFSLTEGEHYTLKNLEKEIQPEEHSGGDRTLSLIDAFLASVPEEPMKKTVVVPMDATFDYLNYLTGQSESPAAETQESPKLNGQELIDHFLEKSEEEPLIASVAAEEMKDASAEDEEEESDMAQGADEEDESYFTETLAKIYVKQQRYSKALEIIQRLNLKYPKKNAYFADQIRFLEKLIINTKSK